MIPDFISSVLGKYRGWMRSTMFVIDDDYDSKVVDKTGIFKLASILRLSQE